jgi:catechol 2,3-dioxygenase-like lactoylglutathione lyase family enzyme
MYDHIGLKVGNLDASVRFYRAALAPLGFVLCSKDEGGAGFGRKGEPALWLYLHKGLKSEGAHIAFRAPDHAAIKTFHAEGIKAGGHDYSPTYYAAFLIDPDGNNVEAVCTSGNVVIARSPRQNCEAILRWSDEAIQTPSAEIVWIASLRSQ